MRKRKAPTLLTAVLDEYISSHDLGRDSARHLRYVLGRFERWLGRASTTKDLDDAQFNTWLDALLNEGLAKRTVKGYRGAMLTVWHSAFQTSAVDQLPRRVRRMRCPRLVVIALTPQDVTRLVNAAKRVKGQFRSSRPGVAHADWLRAVVLVAWDTGLRLTDLLAIRHEDIDRRGVLALVQHKTGTPIYCPLSPFAQEAVAKLGETGPIFGFVRRGRAFRMFSKLKREAGVTCRGKFHEIRKAAATAIEKSYPGQAGVFLGHLTPGLAMAHYVDQRQLQRGRPTPPGLKVRAVKAKP